MSNVIEVTLPNFQASADDAAYDVINGGSMSLIGSYNNVSLESGSGNFSVSGTNNTVTGTATGITVNVSGSSNVVQMGTNTGNYIDDTHGTGDTITVGAGGQVIGGINTTINATQGEVDVETECGSGDIVNADNDVITVCTSATVNGNGNRITQEGGTLELSGSNNNINTVDGQNEPFTITTSSGSLSQSGSGIVMTGSVGPGAATLTGGVLSVQLGSGNIATLSGVSSGSQLEYVDASGKATYTTVVDSDLISTGRNQYSVVGGVVATMSNTTFDVKNGASLKVTGTSDKVTLETGAGSSSVSGTNNTVTGTATGITVNVSGSSNVVQMGTNTGNYIDDTHGTGDTITVGAGGQVIAGINTTINATQGGVDIEAECGSNSAINANGDLILTASGPESVTGNSNQIQLDNTTLNLNGSNNAISFNANDGAEMIQTAQGYYVQEDANGVISFSASSFSSNNSAVTLGLGQGNYVTISNVNSGSRPNLFAPDGQVSQLVSSMATYTSEPVGTVPSVSTQILANTYMLAAAPH